MAAHNWGNPPITSTGAAPIAAPSTATLCAELDSTQLGTWAFAVGQKAIVQVTYIVGGGDTNITWQLGTCNSTALTGGVDEFYPRTVTAQTAQYVVVHELYKDYRIRARQFSTGANGAAYIQAVVQT